MSGDITKKFKSIQGFENRFDIEKETKSNLIEKYLYGNLRSRARFDAYVLHGWNYTDARGGKVDDTGRYIACHLRPVELHNFMIPSPCPNLPSDAKFIVSMHPIAISQSPLKSTDTLFSVGDVVSCYWDQTSPAFKGHMRGLKFELGKVSHARGNYNFTCLEKASRLGFGGGQPLGKTGKHKWANVMIKGSEFPDGKITNKKNVKPNKHVKEKYIPVMEKVMANDPKGLRLLATVMTIKEGYHPGTRSYKHNNPGNIGNTDKGNNKTFSSLEAGIKKQRDYILSVAGGTHRAYPLGKKKKIKPYYSEEIAKYQKTYRGKSPWLPGYEFVYTGQVDQFVKIYSTGARGSNGYLSLILSYFKQNGYDITAQSKIQDIIKLN